jgi:hypothetical protein
MSDEKQPGSFFEANQFLTRTLEAFATIKGAVANDKEAVPATAALEIGEGLMFLGASIAHSLQRIAAAQEEGVRLSLIDINATIDEEVKARLDPAVNAEIEKRAKRSYIGIKS